MVLGVPISKFIIAFWIEFIQHNSTCIPVSIVQFYTVLLACPFLKDGNIFQNKQLCNVQFLPIFSGLQMIHEKMKL